MDEEYNENLELESRIHKLERLIQGNNKTSRNRHRDDSRGRQSNYVFFYLLFFIFNSRFYLKINLSYLIKITY